MQNWSYSLQLINYFNLFFSLNDLFQILEPTWSLKKVLDLQFNTFLSNIPTQALLHKSLYFTALALEHEVSVICAMFHLKNLLNFHE